MKKHLMMLLMLSWTFPSMAAARVKDKCVGIASYYSRRHEGRKQANGKRFHMEKLTAAHRSLPFGTKVRVINLENMKTVDVEITDRGPWIKGRILDLSAAAASRLDMVRKGVARVMYVVLPEPETPLNVGEL